MVDYVTVEELVSKWWPIRDLNVTREQVDQADWDELLALLEIECPDCTGLNIQVTDVDESSERLLVTFGLFRK